METVTQAEGRTGLYRGWQVVVAGFISGMLCIGGTIYIFGLLVLPITEEFGLSRADANSGLIALLVGMALWSPIVGKILDKTPIRLVMPIGAALFALGFVIIATSQSLVVMALAAVGPLALGMSAAGSLAASTVAARWFRRRRGRAMGIVAVATSTGGFLVPPIAAALIAAFGWRQALLILGLTSALVIITVSLLLMRDRPSEAELQQAGELDTAQPDHTAVAERSWTLKELMRERNFWLIMGGAGLLLASDQAMIATKVPYFLDKGVSLQAASFLIACQSGSAICGKLIVGYLADRFDIRALFGVIALFHIVMLVLYVMWPGYWVMLAAVSIIGVAIGGVYPVWMTLTAATFGSRSFGLALGMMSLLIQPLSIIALRYSGEVFDRTGSYDIAFLTFLGVVVLSFVLITQVRLPAKVDPEPN